MIYIRRLVWVQTTLVFVLDRGEIKAIRVRDNVESDIIRRHLQRLT